MKKRYIILPILIVSVLAIFIIFTVNREETKTIYGIKAEAQPQNAIQEISSNLKELNICCDYIEEYFSEPLPNDINTLTDIRNNINEVLDEGVYEFLFNDSNFKNKLTTDVTYYKNDGFFDESFLKRRYYSQLITIKLKIDLILGDYSTFSKDFIENYNIISITLPYYFCSYISTEPIIIDDEEALSVVLDSYEQILELSENSVDTYIILSDMYRLNSIEKLPQKQKNKIDNDFHEIIESNEIKEAFVGSNLISYGLKTDKLNQDKEFVFSYETSEF